MVQGLMQSYSLWKTKVQGNAKMDIRFLELYSSLRRAWESHNIFQMVSSLTGVE